MPSVNLFVYGYKHNNNNKNNNHENIHMNLKTRNELVKLIQMDSSTGQRRFNQVPVLRNMTSLVRPLQIIALRTICTVSRTGHGLLVVRM